jgi:hypothetical protein
MTLSEAAAAYAAARCLAARVRDPLHRITTDHPTTCGWCDYPTDVLDRMVRGFNELADYDRRNGTSASDAVAFDRLDRDEQRRRVTAAQALVAPPAQDPVQSSEPPPADVAPSTPEAPDWARRPS